MTTPTNTQLRTADLPTLATALNDQRTRAVDVVMPAKSIRCEGGQFVLSGLPPQLDDDGVTEVNGTYTPTRVADEGIAAKLDIPSGYLRRMRDNAMDLYDVNVNGWLQRDPRTFLVRMLRDADAAGVGVMRAFLSDSYRTIDNFDVLLAALKGIKAAGIDSPTIDADLTDRRMVVRVQVPEIAVLAPTLLAGYRNPLADAARAGVADPLVFAGFVLTNSETGGGAFNITPRLVVKICNNGMTIATDALRKVHMGAKLDEGIVKWSEATAAANLALVTSQTTDAVSQFISREYVEAQIKKIERTAGVEISDAPAVIATVSKRLGFSEVEQRTILDHFVRGGQMTCGGVLQAVTSAAQTLADGDDALDLELQGLAAMEHAYIVNRARS